MDHYVTEHRATTTLLVVLRVRQLGGSDPVHDELMLGHRYVTTVVAGILVLACVCAWASKEDLF
jgi:hypothetical protein